ncbi:MAG: RNA methyltransferase PUA domain-containing protein, partial [Acidobacteriota bacterium]
MERRFFIRPGEISAQGVVRIHGAEAGHLSRVLRGKPGDRVELVDGSGRTYRARLERVGVDHAIARVEEEMPFRLGES